MVELDGECFSVLWWTVFGVGSSPVHPIDEVFDEAVVREHNDVDNFDEMVAASPSDATTADELGTVGDGDWDAFIAETTAFEDEEAFVFAARDYWVAVQLGLD